ncbi:ABC-type transport auxiliary lipoprotein family protein [Halomonas organivorans]
MKPSPVLLALLALFWLSGCAIDGEPATRYALPQPAPSAAAADVEATRVLVVRPLRLAPFLDVEGIVVQLDDVTLHEASGHRWAEPLGGQLERRLRDRLAIALRATRVVLEDDVGAGADGLQLRVTVERFQGRPDGHAVAAGRWRLLDAEGAQRDAASFEVTTPLARDGYPALVRALGHSWSRLADELAEALRPRLR